MYLVAIIDVFSRYIVSWELGNTLETIFCLKALKSALKLAKPEIVNSDQGCQFTDTDWVSCVLEAGSQVSMTGKGRCLDNVYIERFWRSFKQEEFYLNDYKSVTQLRIAIEGYIQFYNHKRWHQALGDLRPAEVYLA